MLVVVLYATLLLLFGLAMCFLETVEEIETVFGVDIVPMLSED
jgi:hypothetical protein